MQVRKQQLELDMEQQTSSKQEKEKVKAVYCHPEYIMRNAELDEAQAESRFLEEASITSDMQMTPDLWQKVKKK